MSQRHLNSGAADRRFRLDPRLIGREQDEQAPLSSCMLNRDPQGHPAGWHPRVPFRRLGAGCQHAAPEGARDGRMVRLSYGEFSLLIVLLEASNRVLSRDQILDMSRLHSDDVYNRSVNTQILRLRRTLETDPAKPRYICTERGTGYVFSARVEIID